jgi:hypothetical protein
MKQAKLFSKNFVEHASELPAKPPEPKPTPQLPFKCELCGQGCKSSGGLKNHAKIHEEGYYYCEYAFVLLHAHTWEFDVKLPGCNHLDFKPNDGKRFCTEKNCPLIPEERKKRLRKNNNYDYE